MVVMEQDQKHLRKQKARKALGMRTHRALSRQQLRCCL